MWVKIDYLLKKYLCDYYWFDLHFYVALKAFVEVEILRKRSDSIILFEFLERIHVFLFQFSHGNGTILGINRTSNRNHEQ